MLALEIPALIVSIATLITALGGILAIMRQNSKQHLDNQSASASALRSLETKFDIHTEKFDVHMSEEHEQRQTVVSALDQLRDHGEILFGMIVGVDAKVTNLTKRKKGVSVETPSPYGEFAHVG